MEVSCSSQLYPTTFLFEVDYTIAYQDLYSLRHSTAELLAFAVSELYPNIELRGAKAGPEGFSYTFFFPNFTPSFLELIEQKMNEIAKQDVSIDLKTMVFASAKGYLEHMGLKKKIEPECEYTFIKLGDFEDLASPYQVKNTAQIRHFLLTGYEQKDREIEIFGNCFLDKESLKDFKKKNLKTKQTDSYLVQENLLSEEGVSKRDALISSWKSLVHSLGFYTFQNLNPSNKILKYEQLPSLCSEILIEIEPVDQEKSLGLLDTEIKIQSQEMISDDKELISYLQSLEKWLKLLELDRYSLFLLTSKKKKLEGLKNILASLNLSYEEKRGAFQEKLCLFIEDDKKRAWHVFELTKKSRWIGKILSFERVLGLIGEKENAFWKKVASIK